MSTWEQLAVQWPLVAFVITTGSGIYLSLRKFFRQDLTERRQEWEKISQERREVIQQKDALIAEERDRNERLNENVRGLLADDIRTREAMTGAIVSLEKSLSGKLNNVARRG